MITILNATRLGSTLYPAGEHNIDDQETIDRLRDAGAFEQLSPPSLESVARHVSEMTEEERELAYRLSMEHYRTASVDDERDLPDDLDEESELDFGEAPEPITLDEDDEDDEPEDDDESEVE